MLVQFSGQFFHSQLSPLATFGFDSEELEKDKKTPKLVGTSVNLRLVQHNSQQPTFTWFSFVLLTTSSIQMLEVACRVGHELGSKWATSMLAKSP